MTEEKLTQEQADEKLIDDAFQELLDRYLESKHRKKLKLLRKPLISPDRRTKECADVRANLISYIL